MSRFVIRPARIADVPEIVDLAVESVTREPLPVRVDRAAMAETARTLIAGNQHFAWVAEDGGKVVAAVGAAAQPGFWFERLQASVLMFYCRAPGAGIALLREFARWVKARPAIKMAVFSLEPNADPRVEKLLARLGFGLRSVSMTYVKGL